MPSMIPTIWDDGTWEGTTRIREDSDYGGTGIAPRLGNANNYVSDQTRDQDDRWQYTRVLGNVFADVKIIEGLNFRSSFGGSFNTW